MTGEADALLEEMTEAMKQPIEEWDGPTDRLPPPISPGLLERHRTELSALTTMQALAGAMPVMIGLHDKGGLVRYQIAPLEYQWR